MNENPLLPPVILTSAYLPPVQYFTKLYGAPYVVMEHHEHYVKQTYRNRCIIDSPGGPLALSIPVEHDGTARPTTRDVHISDHGNWRHLHWNALVSTYENSPYFDYYADDFRPFYERRYEWLADFNDALTSLVLDLLDLRPDLRPTPAYAVPGEGEADCRESIRPKIPHTLDARFTPSPYYQVFAGRHGFLPNLSIADLLFNMGPESRLVLRRSIAG